MFGIYLGTVRTLSQQNVAYLRIAPNTQFLFFRSAFALSFYLLKCVYANIIGIILFFPFVYLAAIGNRIRMWSEIW